MALENTDETGNQDVTAQPPVPALITENEDERLRWYLKHADEYRERLLANIKSALPELERLLTQVEDHWGMEDGVYRFYHGSFKVYYRLQPLTLRMVTTFQALLPDRPLNECFRQIVAEGTGKKFEAAHNEDWLRHTRPIVEAFFHAHYFLKMTCKYGRELDEEPSALPSGWAAVLYLYDLR
jgi:hypothetical protein